VPVHPRHHEAAVAAAGGHQPVAVDVALAQHEVGAGLDVGQLALAPLAVDRLDELLPE